MNRTSLSKLIGKAKKLKREGHFPIEDFKEIKIEQKALHALAVIATLKATVTNRVRPAIVWLGHRN